MEKKRVLCLSPQIWIHVLTFIALGLESARPTVRMTPAVSAMTNVPHIRIQCALRTEQHTTINAGTSLATVEDWKITLSIIREAVKVIAIFAWVTWVG